MLQITSIEKGIVIDHIPAGFGIKLFNYLKLDKAEYTVALINNAFSKRMGGKKDIIKINNEIDLDVNFLGLINPNITINVIENNAIVKKVKLKVPKKVVNVIQCKNPRCVTSIEGYADHIFHLVDPEKRSYRCDYCDDIVIPHTI
jgi:aspartate carbamoyltransferase regulatory subunit